MCTARRVAWGLLAAMTVAACSSPAPKGDPGSGDQSAVVTATRVAEKPDEVTLTPVKWPELQKAIASHKGNVVVLDVWGEF
jgi:hypothetical protein